MAEKSGDMASMGDAELSREMASINEEFETLKKAVMAGLKRLDDLSREYIQIQNELNRRAGKPLISADSRPFINMELMEPNKT